jgi:hypothetical protein
MREVKRIQSAEHRDSRTWASFGAYADRSANKQPTFTAFTQTVVRDKVMGERGHILYRGTPYLVF